MSGHLYFAPTPTHHHHRGGGANGGGPTDGQRELGPLVAGKTLFHLQCHFGIDTLNWARLGASVTGLDFSEPAIEAARRLSAESGIPARFVCANVYDAPVALGESFDVVYTGIGALCWLPEIRGWAAVAAACVRPGGVLYLYV